METIKKIINGLILSLLLITSMQAAGGNQPQASSCCCNTLVNMIRNMLPTRARVEAQGVAPYLGVPQAADDHVPVIDDQGFELEEFQDLAIDDESKDVLDDEGRVLLVIKNKIEWINAIDKYKNSEKRLAITLNFISSREQHTFSNQDFALISQLSNIENLELLYCKKVTSLAPCAPLQHLKELYIVQCGIKNPLKAFSVVNNFKKLSIGERDDFSDISGCLNLECLNLSNCPRLQDISFLAALTKLKRLELDFCDGLNDSCLVHLEALTELRELSVACSRISEDAKTALLTRLNNTREELPTFLMGTHPRVGAKSIILLFSRNALFDKKNVLRKIGEFLGVYKPRSHKNDSGDDDDNDND